MSKEQDFYNTLNALERAYSTVGISTVNPCSIKGCTHDARGNGMCATHIANKLAEIIGDKNIAIEIHEAVLNKRIFTLQALRVMEKG